MKARHLTRFLVTFVLHTLWLSRALVARGWEAKVTIDWGKVVQVSRTAPTYQIVATKLQRPNSPIRRQIYEAMRDLGAEYVRFQAWFPWPKLAVAELKPPQDGTTYWDFSDMDPIVVDFLEATKGHKIILNLATIPEWMFKTPNPVPYPADPDEMDYGYEQGTELRDPSMKEVADYFARLFSWYTQAGFKDEYGQWHGSNHHFKIDYWEILNEVESEHRMTPETYTALYDAVVEAIRHVDPNMKFVGMALGGEDNPRFFEYFLNHQNHKPGIPIDMISYHFYAQPKSDEDPYVQQFTIFSQADGFLSLVKYIDLIRQRLSPQTQTTIDELGIISVDDQRQNEKFHISKPIPDSYWKLSAAMYAHAFNELSHLGIGAVGMSSGIAYPNNNFPSVTMLDWTTGQPNARYWALKLLIDSVGPGDKQVETRVDLPFIEAQAYITPAGQRKMLLLNKRDQPFEVAIPNSAGATERYVDQDTNFHPAASRTLNGNKQILGGFAVSIITFPQ